jgi:ABC-2 type transport system ATP-binding protein
MSEDGSTCQVVIEQEEGSNLSEAVFFAFCGAGKPILRMETTRASLEEVFLELTGQEEDAEKEEEKP